MNKKKIELQVLNISNSQAQAGAYAMVLGEINGMRQLPVIIGSAEAQSMMIEMRGIVPPRPLTHTLFASVLKVLGATLLRVLIYKVDNGVFYSYLYMKTEETILRIDARTSDAVALALRMDAPIFIYDVAQYESPATNRHLDRRFRPASPGLSGGCVDHCRRPPGSSHSAFSGFPVRSCQRRYKPAGYS